MKTFKKETETLLATIISSNPLHAKWINTLSFLENCGARQIAACEHPTLVKEKMLKHAAEEFRHAHHLKKQMQKLKISMETYSLNHILGGIITLHYLPLLNLKTSRYLKKLGLSKIAIKEAAYLLVTYAIELRADALYPIYDKALQKAQSSVIIKSILLEEKEHLEEMKEGLQCLPSGFIHAEQICAFEGDLYKNWLFSIMKEISFI